MVLKIATTNYEIKLSVLRRDHVVVQVVIDKFSVANELVKCVLRLLCYLFRKENMLISHYSHNNMHKYKVTLK